MKKWAFFGVVSLSLFLVLAFVLPKADAGAWDDLSIKHTVAEAQAMAVSVGLDPDDRVISSCRAGSISVTEAFQRGFFVTALPEGDREFSDEDCYCDECGEFTLECGSGDPIEDHPEANVNLWEPTDRPHLWKLCEQFNEDEECVVNKGVCELMLQWCPLAGCECITDIVPH